MEPLKNFYSFENAGKLSRALKHAWPSFPHSRFLRGLEAELHDLELKDRMQLLANRVSECLPPDISTKVEIIMRSLAKDENDKVGVRGFLAWPLSTLIAREGQSDFDLSLKALKAITKVFTAEFDLRPFLEKSPDRTLKVLKSWVRDKDHHVRRLVSEGTRPRLPWGSHLKEFQKNPDLSKDLLFALRKDPSLYVRKSVANHLNDHTKAHPEWTLSLLEKWKKLDPDDPHLAWIIKHALRTLIKSGHPRALKLVGIIPEKSLASCLKKLTPKVLVFGKKLEFEIEITNRSKSPREVLVDYVVHFQKADGRLSPKVFKGRRKVLGPGEVWSFTRQHAFKPQTTRRYFAGPHALSWQVNGVASTVHSFQLKL